MNQTMDTNRQPETLALNVKLQYEMNTLLYYSLPLCIILANEKLIPWYYENFIEIFSHNLPYMDKEYLNLYYLCDINTNRYNTNFYANLADEICLGYDLLKREPDIVPFMIENIRKGYYVIAYLDEYYLPDKEAYQNNHFVHESLIYGYDDLHQEFMAIGFDFNHSFGMMKFDYPMVAQAFEQGKLYYSNEGGGWAETMALRLIKPFDFTEEYPFSIQRYLAKLNNYRCSKVAPSRIYSFRLPNNETCQFGMNVYNAVEDHLKKMLKGKLTLSFKELHFLYEHKKYIDSSLNYIHNRFKFGNDFQPLMAQYHEIVQIVNDIRLIFLKYTFQKRKDLNNVEEMIRKVEKVRDDENRILTEIIDYLNAVISKAQA